MTSLTACALFQKKPEPPTDVTICPSSAFIDIKEYEVTKQLKTKSDKEYHQWVADNYLKPYPIVLNAYADLRGCWEYYHPTTGATK